MAQAIPDELPSKASGGEERLFKVLKRLPDDVVVYFEPVVDHRNPDFVVILPGLGVMVIETKGWYLANLIAADANSVRVREGDNEAVRHHPLRQVKDYKFRLMDECARDKQFWQLVNLSGPHEGRLSFPVGSFAVLTNISRSNLAEFPGSKEVFPASSVATRDQLLEWEALAPEKLLEVLKGYFDPFWPIRPMTENQVKIIKALLHREILLALEFPKGQTAEPTIKVLDAKQETLARKIGAAHRLVFGVAGSGKTVLLIARAKLLARFNPACRVLVLVYNATFAAYLADALRDCRTATVMNFHAWAASNGATWDKTDDSQLGSTLLELLRRDGRDGLRPAPDAKRYDSVLIDEAQDFEADWFQCALAAMRDPKDGDLLVVGDRGQGMYRRSKISWKQLGIEAAGRTQYLRQNYRNTRPLLRLASLFSSKSESSNEDDLGHVWSDPECCARPTGSDPVLVKRTSKKDEIERTIGIVCGLLRGVWFDEKIQPVKPEDIGVLYPRIRNDDRNLIKDFCNRLSSEEDTCPAVWLSESSASRRKIGDPGIKILTAHAAKGLQFKAVVFLFANECPAHFADMTEEDERRLFYVALTRAEDFLAVSYSGPSKFIDEIKDAMQQGTGPQCS